MTTQTAGLFAAKLRTPVATGAVAAADRYRGWWGKHQQQVFLEVVVQETSAKFWVWRETLVSSHAVAGM